MNHYDNYDACFHYAVGVEMLKAAIESEKQGSYKSARDMYLEAAEK